MGGGAAENDLRTLVEAVRLVVQEQPFEAGVAEPAASRPADLERVRQGEQLGGGGIENDEVPGVVDGQGRVGQGMDQLRHLGSGGLGGGGGPGGAQPGGHLTLQRAEGAVPGGVGGFGHQQDEGARLAGDDRQAHGELRPGGELGDDRIGGGQHRHVRSRDQPDEAGMAAGRADPVTVDPAPVHDLDASRAGGEADEPGPGAEPGGGHVEGGRGDLADGGGGGDRDQSIGQGEAVLVVAAGQDAGGGAGGQGQSGTVGQGDQRPGLQRPGGMHRPGHHQGRDDGPLMADGNAEGGEINGRIGAESGLPLGERFLGGLEQHGVLRPNCHNRGQLPL
jgi:hypothetical protein